MKVKWDLMSDDDNVEPGLEDKALEVLLGEEVCRNIDDEIEEEKKIEEAMKKNVFDWKSKTFSLARRRATDVKGNSRVNFPRKPRSVEEESALQTLRIELMSLFRLYKEGHCNNKNQQKSNLTKHQLEGLRSLKKRVKNGELVVIPTDKSGNLAVISRKLYVESGLLHTKNDSLVGWEENKSSQRELNGHVSMLIKIFKIGSHWNHELRVRKV